MPSNSDFQEAKEAVNPPSFTLSTSLTTFRIPPILQLHIKRTWITGLAIDAPSLADEVHRLDPRVEKSEVISFLNAHIESEEWVKLREDSLNRSYNAMVQDSEKIREVIDQRYDRHFGKIQTLCAEQIDRMQALSDSSNIPLGEKQVRTLKTITTILKDTYLMQRLARGMSQGKYVHEIVKENAEFEEALKNLRERLEEKIIETQVKVLPSL